ncbi:hypothetical protein GIY23_03410 [Allosaccharopolyspora coralli]|uniref:Uncharacterized protein n=1 Tax=Allosaccharopolyspora coralli TaxID=2665642 RepID=A0A5Q3QB77_9PSEU|nr:hypothetical protein [Allosaccharopolyspora coralli]QGK68725.1 hypothetical protein GIY23_03410 [Allosaccharopolyspora coralli]
MLAQPGLQLQLNASFLLRAPAEPHSALRYPTQLAGKVAHPAGTPKTPRNLPSLVGAVRIGHP